MLKNQAGMSLIEITVALALMGVAGVAYMNHMQNVSKNEAKQKVRNTLSQIEVEVVDHLKNRDFCNENIYRAFKDTPITISKDPIVGDKAKTYAILKKFNKNENAVIQSEMDVFKVGTFHDKLAGTVWISDIEYSLSDIKDPGAVAGVKTPYNRTGKLEIRMTFEHCNVGGRVRSLTIPYSDAACLGQVIQSHKVFNKEVAFMIDSSTNLVMTKDLEIFDPKTNVLKVHIPDPSDPAKGILVEKPDPPTAKYTQTPILACGDSQDAIVKESTDYTDKKICQAQVEALMAAGKPGGNKCGQKVIRRKVIYEVTEGNTINNFQFPNEETVNFPTDPTIVISQIVPESVRIFIVSGGGGGHSGSDSTYPVEKHCGGPGKPGNQELNGLSLSISKMLEAKCVLTSGQGGDGGTWSAAGDTEQGRSGQSSVVDCTLKDGSKYSPPNIVHPFGTSGKADCSNISDGTGIMVDNIASAVGTRGHGGIGGLVQSNGGPGGDGVIRITWNQMILLDRGFGPKDEKTEVLHSNGVCHADYRPCWFK